MFIVCIFRVFLHWNTRNFCVEHIAAGVKTMYKRWKSALLWTIIHVGMVFHHINYTKKEDDSKAFLLESHLLFREL